MVAAMIQAAHDGGDLYAQVRCACRLDPCEHEKHRLAGGRIVLGADALPFYAAIQGRELPTLESIFSPNGDAIVLPSVARECLIELGVFQQTYSATAATVVDMDSGEELWASPRQRRPAVICSAGDLALMFDFEESDVLLRRHSTGQEHLRAKRMRVGSFDEPPRVEYTNLETGEPFVVHLMKLVRSKFDYAGCLTVGHRRVRGDFFSYIIEPLRSVFRASMDNGHYAVVWTEDFPRKDAFVEYKRSRVGA